MLSSTDVVVIGGGITGTSAAFQLTQRGLRVALVEKRFIAAGSTGKSSAIIRQHYSNETSARMALYSLRVFQNFSEIVGGDAGFVTTGFVILVDSKDRVGLEENVALQKRVGVNTRTISPDELRELDLGIAEASTAAAAFEPESGYADPASTASSYAEGARQRGASVYQDTRVTAIEMTGGRVKAVMTTNGEISTAAIVNCANAWAPEIGKMVDVSLPVEASRHQVATFQRPRAHAKPHLTAGDFINHIYYRPEGVLLTLVGSIDSSEAEQKADPDHYNESVDYAFIEDASQRIRNRYPYMEQALSKGGWSGIYGVTPDWHPIIDEVPSGSGFFVATGFSGHGFKLGPAVGVMIADMVTRASVPTAGLARSLFRNSRFAENQPVRGKYEYSIVG
ncbi:MAG: FAD-binding oxidoreductase [Chloroflexota bacterium]|nr:FAD-binding oxidoreductase [Chloroflexota bacterium]